MRRNRAGLGFFLLALMGTGCAGAASPSPAAVTPSATSPSLRPSPSAALDTPTPSAPDAASAGPSSGGAMMPSVVGSGPLEPDPYRSTALGPTIEFELASDGWMGQEDIPDVGFALIPSEVPGGVSVVPFNGQVFEEACAGEGVAEIDASAQAFVDWLAAHPDLEVSEPSDVELGGHPAVQVDVDAGVGEACDPWNWLWVLPEPVNDFHLAEGELARIIASDVGDTTVVVVIESFEPADHPELLELAQPILDSMTIEP